MGTRLNRTLLNWRWYIALPVVPFAIVHEVLDWLVNGAVVVALDASERVLLAIFRWQRKGARND